jgi:hypothetical protein
LGRGVLSLERGCWSGGGGSDVLLQLMGGDSSWSKTTWECPSVNVPQHFCLAACSCSSTHKASLAMVLSWI